MDIEFLDPGPNQPYEPVPPALAAGERRPVGPEAVGLLIMLVAAALLPVIAAFQDVYAVRAVSETFEFRYAADGWGRYTADDPAAFPMGLHEPRFGALLCVCAAGFAVLALIVLTRIVRPGPAAPRLSGAAVAGVAGALTGALAGVTAAMTLQIETVFDRLRSPSGPVIADRTIHLAVGGAVWLSLAAVLAGGLAVAAALRVRGVQRAGEGR